MLSFLIRLSIGAIRKDDIQVQIVFLMFYTKRCKQDIEKKNEKKTGIAIN